jgi:hypothetical protein
MKPLPEKSSQLSQNTHQPPPTWRYIDWVGGQEAFDKILLDYPAVFKADYERSIMCADIINGVIECFWGQPEEFPNWVKKHYPHLIPE